MANLVSTKNQNKMRREMSQVMIRAVRLLLLVVLVLVLGFAAGITSSAVFLFFIIIKGYWSLTLKYSFNTLLLQLLLVCYYYSSSSTLPIVVCLWYSSISSLRSWLSSPLYRFLVLNFIIIFIAVSTIFYRSNISKVDDDDGDVDVEVASLSSASTPPSKKGGKYINQSQSQSQSHVQEDVTTAIKTAVVTAAATASSPLRAYNKISANKKADVCIQVFHKQDSQLGNGGRRSKIQLPPPPVHPVKTRNKTTTKTKTNLKRTKNHAEEEEEVVVMTGEITKQHGGAKPANSHDKQKHGTSNRDNYENYDMIESEQTLEETWKAIIMEGEGKPPLWTPQRKQKKKKKKNALKAWQELRNSETFNDAVYAWRRGGLRRGASLSQDELNCQVEAFIQKIFHNIRLQRQESDQRFFEKINRGD